MSDTVFTKPWRAPAPPWRRNPPVGFIRPCEPTLVDRPPAGPGWLHEIKHDSFRVLALKQGQRFKVWSRRGADGPAAFTGTGEAATG
jgi:bifunctional non-homologous end joining protein LigD